MVDATLAEHGQGSGMPVPDLVTSLVEAQRDLRAFAPETVAAFDELARTLRRDAALRRRPELGALAFWLRGSELGRLAEAHASLATEDSVLVPRGLVFHIPPANVDTIFVYSWALAALTGNANVIRVPSRRGEAADALLSVVRGVLSDRRFPRLARSTALVEYGHEVDVTAGLSAGCQVRVIWGGDETVRRIREVPLAVGATELAFPDRHSLALIDASRFLGLDDAERSRLVEAFFNDAFWFGQLGCSSPRVVVWRGTTVDAATAATGFYRSLAETCRRHDLVTPAAVGMAKLVSAFDGAAAGRVSAIHRPSVDVTWLDVPDAGHIVREGPGGGLFANVHVAELAELVPVLERKDQTLSYFGIDRDDLVELVSALNGGALERIVPIGHALSFHRYWDGYDLLQAFSRRVHIMESGIS